MKTQIWIFWAISNLIFVACGTGSKTIIKKGTTLDPIDPTLLDISADLDFIEIDKFENIYWVEGNKLNLKDVRNKRDYLYDNDRLGNISSLDVSNPQKILVFYDDYDIVVTLDNTLSERSRIDLKNFNLTDINAISLSNDNNIWFYDPTTFQLKKIDVNGNTLAQSLGMHTYYLDQITPTKIIETENTVYLLSQEGILLFDNLGQYNKLLPITGINDFQVIDEQVIYINKTGVYNYSIKQLTKFEIEGIDESLKTHWLQYRLGKENYYLAYINGIQIKQRN